MANMAMVCHQHHHRVHEGGWNLTYDPDTNRTIWHAPDGRTLIGQRRAVLEADLELREEEVERREDELAGPLDVAAGDQPDVETLAVEQVEELQERASDLDRIDFDRHGVHGPRAVLAAPGPERQANLLVHGSLLLAASRACKPGVR